LPPLQNVCGILAAAAPSTTIDARTVDAPQNVVHPSNWEKIPAPAQQFSHSAVPANLQRTSATATLGIVAPATAPAATSAPAALNTWLPSHFGRAVSCSFAARCEFQMRKL
jgi:hypothetical protein